MSNVIFPVLQGLKWDRQKAPQFSTLVQRSVSGREARAAQMAYPIWKFTLSFEFLRKDVYAELDSLLGFFLARQGSADSFLYVDPEDTTVTDMPFATGDGSNTTFQLARTIGSFVEPVHNPYSMGAVKVDGISRAFTPGSNGQVIMSAPPGVGSVLSWSGSFYYRCRFTQDEAEFNNMMQRLWELRQISFFGSPLNTKV